MLRHVLFFACYRKEDHAGGAHHICSKFLEERKGNSTRNQGTYTSTISPNHVISSPLKVLTSNMWTLPTQSVDNLQPFSDIVEPPRRTRTGTVERFQCTLDPHQKQTLESTPYIFPTSYMIYPLLPFSFPGPDRSRQAVDPC